MLSALSGLSRLGVAAMVVVSLGACETPDFAPYAEYTADLAATATAENHAVSERFDRLVSLAVETRSSQLQAIRDNSERYRENARAVDELMAVAVSYSAALVEVARAGESGGQAWDRIVGTLSEARTALDVALPALGGTAAEVVNGVGRAIATAITQAQAQETLASAMDAARGPVTAIAEGIGTLHGDDGAQEQIVVGMVTTERALRRELANLERLTLYRGLVVDELPEDGRTRLDFYYSRLIDRLSRIDPQKGLCASGPGGGSREGCLTGQEVQGLFAMHQLLAVIEPAYKDYVEKTAEAEGWGRKRASASAGIVAAVEEWRREHDRLADHLAECGGFNVFGSGCDTLSFANLRAAVERARAIASGGED